MRITSIEIVRMASSAQTAPVERTTPDSAKVTEKMTKPQRTVVLMWRASGIAGELGGQQDAQHLVVENA